MSEWKPISEAGDYLKRWPDDEYFGILTWNGHFIAQAYWYHSWVYANDADEMPVTPQPTHFMNIPSPPNKQE